MSTLTKPDGTSTYVEPELSAVVSYRSVSKAAIFSVCLGVLAISGLLFPGMLFLALLGLICGLIGLRNVRRYPDELSGFTPAVIGSVLCGALFVCGTAWHVFDYVNELPAGYTDENRITWNDLQPDKQHPDQIPARALELDGQKIFIKGYIHPNFSGGEVRSFVMVPGWDTCCFGGQPKVTDMMEVTLREPLRIRYNQRIRKLAGVLTVQKQQLKPVPGLGGVIYQLDAEYRK